MLRSRFKSLILGDRCRSVEHLTTNDRIREILRDEQKHRNASIWCSIHLVVFFFLIYDYYVTFDPTWTDSIKWILSLVFLFNACFHFIQFVRLKYFTSPLLLTPQQYKIYGISFEDPNFKLMSPTSQSPLSTSPNKSLNMSNNWLSSSPTSSPNKSGGVNNVSYFQQSSMYSNNSSIGSPNTSLQNKSKSLLYEAESDVIDTTEQYKEYMRKVNNSFHYDFSPPDHRPAISGMNKYVYQTSPLNPYKTSNDSDSNSKTYLDYEVWDKLGINRSYIIEWKDNIKTWIYRTILVRLNKEISNVNELLSQNNIIDIQIGSVGLEKLKSLTQTNPTISQNIPTLNSIIQYLKISPHQQYVVQRIKDLAKNYQMSEYNWNSGGSSFNKKWEAHLPTDAQLIMHFVFTYFDIMVPPPIYGDKSFSSKYFVQTPNRNCSENLFIYQSSLNPPHYQLIIDQHTYDIPKGRNNMFESLVAFIYYIKTKKQGVLSGLDMGPGGINILWALEQPKSKATSPQKIILPPHWNLS